MDDEVEFYGDTGIASNEGTIPTWIKWVVVVTIAWGFVWLYFFWDGATGWIDRGYWQQLEQAANTTMPWQDADDPSMPDRKQSG